MGSGYFGVAVYHPKAEVNIGTLFRSAWIFGAAFLATIGQRYGKQRSDTLKAPLRIPLLHYLTFDDFKNHLPWACPLVGVELAPSSALLNDFTHPERCVYLLGAEDHGLPPVVLGQCHRVVRMVGRHCLNVAVAGSIVMHDRVVKRGEVLVYEPRGETTE